MTPREIDLPATDRFGALPRGIHHLGVTVPDVEAATTFLREGLGALFCYDGVGANDPPREGTELERILGLPPGARILRQRMLRLGHGPGLELFQIEAPDQTAPAGLADFGITHLALYADDMEAAVARLKAAGAEFLSEVHDNSPHEDTPGNASVYARAPWGMLIELQSIPGGYWYGPEAEAEVWLPPAPR